MKSRWLAWNAVKAIVKGVVGVLVLVAISKFTAPFSEVLPNYGLTFNFFAIFFILLMVASELFSGTIVCHVLNIAGSLLMMGYFLYAFSSSVIVINMENMAFMVDLRIIFSIAVMLSLVGFAKALLGLVGYLAENVKMEGKTLKA